MDDRLYNQPDMRSYGRVHTHNYTPEPHSGAANGPTYTFNAPLFTQQELYGFEPAQQNISQHATREEIGMGAGGWGQDFPVVKQQYPGCQGMDYSARSTHGSRGGFSEASEIYSPHAVQDGFSSSCQTSPFMEQSLSDAPNSFLSSSQPMTPVTPASDSPYHHASSSLSIYNNTTAVPSAFMLVPTMIPNASGQPQQWSYSGYHVPMAPATMSTGGYIGTMSSVPSSQTPIQSQQQSPYQDESPAVEPPALDEDEEEEDEEDEEEEEDEDGAEECVLPNSGNTELRGMGLYDDVPSFNGEFYSPIEPYDQLRPGFGKGMLLEKSFGLPEEVMMKDEQSGKIVKGKLEVHEEEETRGSWASSGVYDGTMAMVPQSRFTYNPAIYGDHFRSESYVREW